MELVAGIDLISFEFGGRPMNLPLVRGQEIALIDTGLANTPTETIIPYLRTLGLAPQDISWVVVTHAHPDHFGGNEALWVASGKTVRFAVHRLDQPWVEDPPRETRRVCQRLVQLGLMSEREVEQAISVSGKGVPVACTLQGGEVFHLGNGVELEVIHAPGHTSGNLCLFEQRTRILLHGETIAGVGQFSTAGEILTCPYWEDIGLYLETIARVARIPFRHLVSSHLPVMNRSRAISFFKDSLDFTLRFHAEVQDRLRAARAPVTALSLARSMDRLWDTYPADLGLYQLVEQQLMSLVRHGLAAGSLQDGFVWQPQDEATQRLERRIDEACQAVEAMACIDEEAQV